jgi:MFS family permease
MLIFLSVTFSFSAAATFLPLLGDDRGLGNVGLFFLVSGAAAIVSRPVAGRASDRIGRVPVVVPGLIATCAAMWLLAVAGAPAMMLLAGAAAGLGMGASHTGLLSYAVDRVPVDEKGRATAVLQMAWDFGGLSGAIVLGMVATLVSVSAVYWVAGVIVLAATAGLLAGAQHNGTLARNPAQVN